MINRDPRLRRYPYRLGSASLLLGALVWPALGGANPIACNPVPADAATAHQECITEYTGPEVCVACHENEARDMHGSVHYQQGGAFPSLINVPEDLRRGRAPGPPSG